MYCWRPSPSLAPDPRLLLVAGLVEGGRVDPVIGDVDLCGVGLQQPDQLVAGGLAGNDDPGGPA